MIVVLVVGLLLGWVWVCSTLFSQTMRPFHDSGDFPVLGGKWQDVPTTSSLEEIGRRADNPATYMPVHFCTTLYVWKKAGLGMYVAAKLIGLHVWKCC